MITEVKIIDNKFVAGLLERDEEKCSLNSLIQSNINGRTYLPASSQILKDSQLMYQFHPKYPCK